MINLDTALADIIAGIDIDCDLWEGSTPWTISRSQIECRVDRYCEGMAGLVAITALENITIDHCIRYSIYRS
jgi:hypothetical protein